MKEYITDTDGSEGYSDARVENRVGKVELDSWLRGHASRRHRHLGPSAFLRHRLLLLLWGFFIEWSGGIVYKNS